MKAIKQRALITSIGFIQVVASTFVVLQLIDWSDCPNQTPYGSFLSHGNIGQLYFGSWYLNMPVLVKRDEYC
jgi:hypothetical protein